MLHSPRVSRQWPVLNFTHTSHAHWAEKIRNPDNHDTHIMASSCQASLADAQSLFPFQWNLSHIEQKKQVKKKTAALLVFHHVTFAPPSQWSLSQIHVDTNKSKHIIWRPLVLCSGTSYIHRHLNARYIHRHLKARYHRCFTTIFWVLPFQCNISREANQNTWDIISAWHPLFLFNETSPKSTDNPIKCVCHHQCFITLLSLGILFKGTPAQYSEL